MAKLEDFVAIKSLLHTAKKSNVVALHKFVFQAEGDRGNRQRLRDFEGFNYDENDEQYDNLNAYVNEQLNDADLTSICVMLGLRYNVANKTLHIFKNLKRNYLLQNDEDDDEDDGIEGPADENVVENNVVVNNTNNGNVIQNNGIENVQRNLSSLSMRHENPPADDETSSYYDDANSQVPSVASINYGRGLENRQVPRFALNFRDIEDSVRQFDGSGKQSVESWVKEFEDMAGLMYWDDFQKYVFAKKSLQGLAKIFVMSEKGISSWIRLKVALLSEFKSVTSKAQIHKALGERKINKTESVQEYFYHMKELASQGDIEDSDLMQYIIDGIRDLNCNKSMLYGAANLAQFKQKLRDYETFAAKRETQTHTQREARTHTQREMKPVAANKFKEDTRSKCFNCGALGHLSAECPNKSKGVKCFKCNKFGHIAKECPAEQTKASNCRYVKNMTKKVSIGAVKCIALLDTGSKYNIITECLYEQVGKSKMTSTDIKLVGIGENRDDNSIKPLGIVEHDVLIDDELFNLEFMVIPSKCLDVKMILGQCFCENAEITINNKEIRIKKNPMHDLINLGKLDEQDELNIEPTASKNSKNKVYDIINNYTPDDGKSTNIEMTIVLTDETPISCRPRRLPFSERCIVDDQVAKWLEEGIIEESDSEFASPVVLVRKKDGTPRLCIDYRQVNKVMVRDHFPLPLIEDQLDRLQDAEIFSIIDLKNAFFHVPVAEASRKYTAFVTHNGVYQFRKVPFGLSNSPSVFQRHINAIFRHLARRGIALPYVDDIIIPAKTEEEALKNLQEVINICGEYGLHINLKKCQFLKKSVEFLGHIIENKKISPAQGKVDAVLNYQVPNNLTKLQSFLGLTGYFRKFVPFYSVIARPLTDLTKQGVKFSMGPEEINAFNQLKKIITEKPVLSIFNEKYKTEVHTDASKEGYGAVFLQVSPEDGQLHPVYYMSKKTTPTERKYSSYELEILAVIEAVKKFRVYLLGRPFKLVTDCDALKKTLDKKDLCTRVARWVLLLQEFTYITEHRPASRIKHVDSLSRYPFMRIDDDLTAKLKYAQCQDSEAKAIIQVLNEKAQYGDYFMKNGLLYRLHDDDELIVVPKAMQRDMIRRAHERGHFAVKKTKDLLIKEFYIPNIDEKIKSHIACCVPCIMINRKQGKSEGELHPLAKGDLPLCTYHVDFLGPLESTSKQYKHLLVIIDGFSKFCWLYATKSTSTHEVLTKLRQQSVTFGNPAVIISDRGSAYTSGEFQQYCESEGIKHHLITTGLPRVNGQVERLNGIISSVLAKLSINNPTKWYQHVEKVQQAINSTYTRSIDTTPFELLIGTKMRNKDDLKMKELLEQEFITSYQDERQNLRDHAKEQIKAIQQENRSNYNKKRKPATKYAIGDLVAIKRTQFGSGLKLKAKYLGPYQVTKAKQNNSYDVIKIGDGESPMNTTSCAEFMKSWHKNTDDVLTDLEGNEEMEETPIDVTNDEAVGAIACQNGRVVE